MFKDESNLISLLPIYNSPSSLLIYDRLPCSEQITVKRTIEQARQELNRTIWTEGLYVKKNDLTKIKRYNNSDGSYKNDFEEQQFLRWVKTIEENTAICCDMEFKNLGKGVFVPYGKKLPQGTFIPSSGIIKLDPNEEELATKVHCSALQDLNTPKKTIYGFIDPAQIGGILDLINHAPDKNELINFNFRNPSIKKRVSTSNLHSTIKFYNGYAIMGLEAIEDIDGGELGQQLLWSYARSYEYLNQNTSKLGHSALYLFDNAYQGKIIDPHHYSLKTIDIFIDKGKLMPQKIASLTRWEIMEDSSDSEFLILEHRNAKNPNEPDQFYIERSFLQSHLRKNPMACRIILDVTTMK